MLQQLIRPTNEVFPVRSVGMSAVVLTPRNMAIEEADIDCGHFFRLIIRAHPQVLSAEQAENRLSGYSSHVAALMVQPPRVALFRYSVADKRKPGRAECQKLVGIHREVPRRLASKRGLR